MRTECTLLQNQFWEPTRFCHIGLWNLSARYYFSNRTDDPGIIKSIHSLLGNKMVLNKFHMDELMPIMTNVSICIYPRNPNFSASAAMHKIMEILGYSQILVEIWDKRSSIDEYVLNHSWPRM